MLVYETTAVKKINELKQRLRVIEGGSSAGKTIAILTILIAYSQTYSGKSTSIVSESLPHLRRGAMRDFFGILYDHKYYDINRHNKTENIYTFETGSFVEFFGLDQPEKARGPRRDALFINEANNVPYAVFDQLEIRTNDFIFLDHNPVAEYWAHTEIINKLPHDFLRLTYKDNEKLSPEIIKSIESHKDNPNWWKVYGLGELGENIGQIFTNWEIVQEVPDGAERVAYGVDFGFTNDPSSICCIWRFDGEYYLEEVAQSPGMSNEDIADVISAHYGWEPAEKRKMTIPVICDSAEPKSITELRKYGLEAIGAEKGADSVRAGIQIVQDIPVKVTARSLNYIKAFRNYVWKVDRITGKPTNIPDHEYSHAPDSYRYALTYLHNPKKKMTLHY